MLLASGNRHKLHELQRALEVQSLCLLLPMDVAAKRPELGAPPTPLEDQPDYFGNAFAKAAAFSQWAGMPALADDSGLEVDALGGRPGVRSARYAGEAATTTDNLEHLLAELAAVPPPLRTARFVCQIVCVSGTDLVFQARGVCEGTICDVPRGEQGFGYDPVFVPHGETRSFAEMQPAEKDKMSHRGRALERLAQAFAAGRFGARASTS